MVTLTPWTWVWANSEMVKDREVWCAAGHEVGVKHHLATEQQVIHSSVHGHLGCLHLLPIMNSAAINICVHVSVLPYVFISIGHILRSWIIAQWLHHFIFPLAVCKFSNFSMSSPKVFIMWLFDCSHPIGCEMVSPCGFNLYSPDN